MAKIHWILPTHSNVTSKVGFTLAGPPCRQAKQWDEKRLKTEVRETWAHWTYFTLTTDDERLVSKCNFDSYNWLVGETILCLSLHAKQHLGLGPIVHWTFYKCIK